MSDAASILTACGAVLAPLSVIVATVTTHRRIREVKQEVTTMNGQTIAALAEASEVRRVASSRHRRMGDTQPDPSARED